MEMRELRKRKGLSQQEVSKILGVDQKTYSNYENGKTKPNFEVLQKISKLFSCSIDDLVGNKKSTDKNVSTDQLDIINRIRALDLTPVECARLDGYIDAIVMKRQEKQKQRINNLISDINNSEDTV